MAQALSGVAALPVQYSAYPVYGSALAEMSGTSRHGVPGAASEQFVVPLPYVDVRVVHARPLLVERPAPVLAGPAAAGARRGAPEEAALVVVARVLAPASLHRLWTFQTVSVPVAGGPGFGLVPGLSLSSEVPPTLVTHGWDDGSPLVHDRGAVAADAAERPGVARGG